MILGARRKAQLKCDVHRILFVTEYIILREQQTPAEVTQTKHETSRLETTSRNARELIRQLLAQFQVELS